MEKDIEITLTELDLSTDFIKLGDTVYTVNRINRKMDIAVETKEYYKKKYDSVVKELKEFIYRGYSDDWLKQINKITQLRQEKKIVMPSNLENKEVIYKNKEFLVLKSVMYHPVEFHCCKNDVKYLEVDETIWKKFSKFSSSQPLLICVSSDISIPFNVAFSDLTKTVYTIGFRTFHSYSGNNKLCIGNAKYEDYKALTNEELSLQVSKVNVFSLATSDIVVNEDSFSIRDLVTPDTFISVKKEEDRLWTTV